MAWPYEVLMLSPGPLLMRKTHPPYWPEFRRQIHDDQGVARELRSANIPE